MPSRLIKITSFLLVALIIAASIASCIKSNRASKGSEDNKSDTTVPNTVGQINTTYPPASTTTGAITTAKPWTPSDPPTSTSDIVNVSDYFDDIIIDIRYGGTNNSTKTQIYKYDGAYLRYDTLLKLEKAKELLEARGLTLVIWDAFRPLEAQMSLYYTQPECLVSPASGEYVRYSHGDAVSIAAADKDGNIIDLPSDFFGEGRSRNLEGATDAQKANVQMLNDIMANAGFLTYLDEWYSYVDSTEHSLAATLTVSGGKVVECESWIVNCDESISLRSTPSLTGDTTISINAGEFVKVIFFTEKFAYCEYNGNYGYAHAAYIKQTDENGYKSVISTVDVCYDYDYYKMQDDLAKLKELYPDTLTLRSIGKSEEGRDMTVAIVGNPDAENRIFISAAIHAREYMTATLAMAQIEYLLSQTDMLCGVGDMTVGDMLNDVCICFLPFTNPDGAYIVTSGKLPEMFKNRYNSSYTSKWKANALGVDLNANFDADWEDYGGYLGSTTRPSFQSYKGTAPESAAEAKAVADYIRSEDFDLVLVYHTAGSYIYDTYRDHPETNAKCNKIARFIAGRSGYVIGQESKTSTAGLHDWAVSIGIPSLTIECGTSSSPLMMREFDNLWARLKDVPILSYLWVAQDS